MTQAPAPPQNLRMGALDWGLLLLLSILWGGTFFFGKIAVREISPFTIVLARVGIAAAILAVVVVASGAGFPKGIKAWAPFFVMGLVNNVIPFSLIFWGQQEIGAGFASVLNAATPLSGAVMAHLLTDDEKLRSNRLIGVLLGMAGVAVLVGPSGLRMNWGPMLGAVAVLASTFSYGFAGVWGRRFRAVPALTSSCCQLTCSSLIMVPVVIFVDRPWLRGWPGSQAIMAVLVIAVLATAFAYVIFFTILRRAGGSNVMLVTLLVPFSATGLSITFLGEQVRATDLAGAALVGLALIIIDGRAYAALRGMAAGPSAAG